MEPSDPRGRGRLQDFSYIEVVNSIGHDLDTANIQLQIGKSIPCNDYFYIGELRSNQEQLLASTNIIVTMAAIISPNIQPSAPSSLLIIAALQWAQNFASMGVNFLHAGQVKILIISAELILRSSRVNNRPQFLQYE